MNYQLLQKSEPTDPVVKGTVGPTEVVPPDEETAAARLRELAIIGNHAQDIGLREICLGIEMTKLHMLNAAMQALTTRIPKLEAKQKKTKADLSLMVQLMECTADLSTKTATCQRLLLGAEKPPSPDEMNPPRPLVPPFPPGEIVNIGPAMLTNPKQDNG